MTRTLLKVNLTQGEDEQLFELRDDASVPKRTKLRAEMLRLNHRGWQTKEIAEYLDCRVETVRRAIYRWQAGSLENLWDAPREGRPRSWDESDMGYIEQQLDEPGTFNSRQVVELLNSARDVQLSRRHVSRLLKKRGTVGSAQDTATSKNKTLSSVLPSNRS